MTRTLDHGGPGVLRLWVLKDEEFKVTFNKVKKLMGCVLVQIVFITRFVVSMSLSLCHTVSQSQLLPGNCHISQMGFFICIMVVPPSGAKHHPTERL